METFRHTPDCEAICLLETGFSRQTCNSQKVAIVVVVVVGWGILLFSNPEHPVYSLSLSKLDEGREKIARKPEWILKSGRDNEAEGGLDLGTKL